MNDEKSAPTIESTSTTNIKEYTVRSGDYWTSIFSTAQIWVNSNVHIERIISIGTTLCHYNAAGMVTILYDTAKTIDEKKGSYVLDYTIIRNSGQWVDHKPVVVKKVSETINAGGRIISTNFLEVNEKHDDCFTVIWFERKK